MLQHDGPDHLSLMPSPCGAAGEEGLAQQLERADDAGVLQRKAPLRGATPPLPCVSATIVATTAPTPCGLSGQHGRALQDGQRNHLQSAPERFGPHRARYGQGGDGIQGQRQRLRRLLQEHQRDHLPRGQLLLHGG